jgi:hypothetical protein
MSNSQRSPKKSADSSPGAPNRARSISVGIMIATLVSWGGILVGAALLGAGLAYYAETRPPSLSGGLAASIGLFLLLVSITLVHAQTRTAPSWRGGGYPRRGVAFASAGAVLLTMMIAAAATAIKPQSQRAGGLPSASESVAVASPSSSCQLLQPEGPTSPTADSDCGGLTLERVVAVLDCTHLSSLPDQWNFVGYDSVSSSEATNPSGYGGIGATLSYANSSCRLGAPEYQLEARLSTAHATSDDVVIIADFIPRAGSIFETGIAARCSVQQCVSSVADSEGQAWMAERAGSPHWVTHAHQPVKLRIDQENRMVMRLNSDSEVSWVNGQLIGTTKVHTGRSQGDVRFFVVDMDSSAPAVIDVRRLVVLGVGS